MYVDGELVCDADGAPLTWTAAEQKGAAAVGGGGGGAAAVVICVRS
jgi:shikimate kinase